MSDGGRRENEGVTRPHLHDYLRLKKHELPTMLPVKVTEGRDYAESIGKVLGIPVHRRNRFRPQVAGTTALWEVGKRIRRPFPACSFLKLLLKLIIHIFHPGEPASPCIWKELIYVAFRRGCCTYLRCGSSSSSLLD